MNRKKLIPAMALGVLGVSIFFVVANVIVITQLLPEHHHDYLPNHPFGILPYAFGSCTSLPCDDANKKLGEPNYRFIDFSYQNHVGKPIAFILEKTAKDECNSYVATITDENGNAVWTQHMESLCVISDDSPLRTSRIKLGFDAGNPIVMSESARYLLKVQIDDGSIEREFVARHNFSGLSIDRTVYPADWSVPPLKQFKNGIPLEEIQCRESFVLMAKSEKRPACVTQSTAMKLSERGWSWILETVYWKGDESKTNQAGVEDLPEDDNSILVNNDGQYLFKVTDADGNDVDLSYANDTLYFYYNLTNHSSDTFKYNVDFIVSNLDDDTVLYNDTQQVSLGQNKSQVLFWDVTPEKEGNYNAAVLDHYSPYGAHKRFIVLDPSKDFSTYSVTILNGAHDSDCKTPCIVPHVLGMPPHAIVEFTNHDSYMHKLSTGTVDFGPDGTFHSSYDHQFQTPYMSEGNSFSILFLEPGKFEYFSWTHPWASGTISVNDNTSTDDSGLFAPSGHILGDAHEHASILVKIFGDKFDFSRPDYQMRSSWIHFEGQDGNTIHRHSKGITLGYLFDTLNLGLSSDCFVFPDGREFCTNEDYSLKFFINGEQVDGINDYEISDGDRILMSYGNKDNDGIEEQLDELNKHEIRP